MEKQTENLSLADCIYMSVKAMNDAELRQFCEAVANLQNATNNARQRRRDVHGDQLTLPIGEVQQ